MPPGVAVGPPTLVEAWWHAQAPDTRLRGVPPSRASLPPCLGGGKRHPSWKVDYHGETFRLFLGEVRLFFTLC